MASRLCSLARASASGLGKTAGAFVSYPTCDSRKLGRPYHGYRGVRPYHWLNRAPFSADTIEQMAFGEIAKQLAQHALADQVAPTPSVTAQSDSAGAIMLGQIQAMQKACKGTRNWSFWFVLGRRRSGCWSSSCRLGRCWYWRESTRRRVLLVLSRRLSAFNSSARSRRCGLLESLHEWASAFRNQSRNRLELPACAQVTSRAASLRSAPIAVECASCGERSFY